MAASSCDDSNGNNIYFVPYRWWKEVRDPKMDKKRGVLYTASSTSSCGRAVKRIYAVFNSDHTVTLTREEESLQNNRIEEGLSERDYALISEEMWLRTLKWHSDCNAAARDVKSSSTVADDMAIYSQLKLHVARKTNSLTIRISRKDTSTERYNRARKICNVENEPALHVWDLSEQTTSLIMNERNTFSKGCQHQSEQEIFPMCRESNIDEAPIQQSSGGLKGLENLGNTCFMNCAIQCLAHTPKIVEYFLGDYSKEIEQDDGQSMTGGLALVFASLLRELWTPGTTPVAPHSLKFKLDQLTSQFSGSNQHDTQEFLTVLLDGLHEDLKRVKGCSDEVAEQNSDSIVADICHGQYRSTVTCTVCKKVSITVDPFVVLSLPLPLTMRTMSVTVFNSDRSSMPSPFTVTVPKDGTSTDLIQAISTACSLKAEETLLVVEIYKNHIVRYFEDAADSLSLIRDNECLVAYRLLNDAQKLPLVVFTHERPEGQHIKGKETPRWKAFGIPLLARLSGAVSDPNIRNLLKTLLKPLERYNDSNATEYSANKNKGPLHDPHEDELQFFLADELGMKIDTSKIEMSQLVSAILLSGRINVLVRWPDKKIEQYDTSFLRPLPQIKSGFAANTPESVPLYSCLDAFMEEEHLGTENLW